MDELVMRLRNEAETERYLLPHSDNGTAALLDKAADAIEELSRAADAIPHVCECCIGCEVESGGCDNAFILSPERAKEYLNKHRWIAVVEENDGKV